MSTTTIEPATGGTNFRLIEKNRPMVLALDDDPVALEVLQETAIAAGFKCVTGSHGEDGLNLFRQLGPAACYVIDLNMPVLDGPGFIARLRELDPDAVILVQTAENNPEKIVEVMKLGVYDCFFKPVNPDLFAATLNRAWEHKKFTSMQRTMDAQAAVKLRSQLEWLTYKEDRRHAESHAQERNLIYNLMTSMNQGAGFGAVLTMIDILKLKGKNTNDGTISFPAEMIDRLFEMADIARTMVEGLESILELIEKDFEKASHPMAELNSMLTETVEHMRVHARERSLGIQTNLDPATMGIIMNAPKVRLAVEEMILNAVKYTPQRGSIDVYTHHTNTFAVFSVMNDVSPEGGIPPEAEKLVVEPFIRLHPPVEMAQKDERFGLGLGLSVVNHIARKHGGMFFIQEVKDYTSGQPRARVLAELFLPLEGAPAP